MENNRCNLCGSERRRLLFKKYEMDIVKCESCGLVYVYPPISDNRIKELYRKKEWKPRRGCAVDRYNKIRVSILQMLKPVGNLLDIGCGDGMFLKEASLKYKTTGIEISPLKTKFGRENLHQNVIESSIYDISLPQSSFDIVTLIRVIEHFRDVAGVLGKINGLMKLGGLLFIKTGNISSRRAKKRGIEWEYIDPPYHLFYFSNKTIKRMLEKNGFRIIKITPGNLDINRILGYIAHYSRKFVFNFVENLISMKEKIKGNSMMGVYALKTKEL